MCRFALYLGQELTLSHLVTDPSNSIIHQSFHNLERPEPLNGDGFGVAWYVPEMSPEPALFRSISPAWNNQNLIRLARVTKSRAILAHVRAATPGLPVTELNCHPFTWGRYAFMHNGLIGGFHRIRRRMLAELSDEAFAHVAGSTDSEHLFAFFADRLRQPDGDGVEAMASALTAAFAAVERLRAAAGIDKISEFNAAVTDGERAVVSRLASGTGEEAPSLYYHVGRRYVCEDGVCRMVDPDGSHRAVIVSSEPLSEDPGWHPVPPNHLVVVHADLSADLRPVIL